MFIKRYINNIPVVIINNIPVVIINNIPVVIINNMLVVIEISSWVASKQVT